MIVYSATKQQFVNDVRSNAIADTLESLKTLIAKFNENEFDELDVIDVWEETELLRDKDQTWVNGLVRKVDGSSKDGESSKADQNIKL